MRCKGNQFSDGFALATVAQEFQTLRLNSPFLVVNQAQGVHEGPVGRTRLFDEFRQEHELLKVSPTAFEAASAVRGYRLIRQRNIDESSHSGETQWQF